MTNVLSCLQNSQLRDSATRGLPRNCGCTCVNRVRCWWLLVRTSFQILCPTPGRWPCWWIWQHGLPNPSSTIFKFGRLFLTSIRPQLLGTLPVPFWYVLIECVDCIFCVCGLHVSTTRALRTCTIARVRVFVIFYLFVLIWARIIYVYICCRAILYNCGYWGLGDCPWHQFACQIKMSPRAVCTKTRSFVEAELVSYQYFHCGGNL